MGADFHHHCLREAPLRDEEVVGVGKGLSEILPVETWAHNGFGIRPKHTPGRVMGDLKIRRIKVLLIS